MVPNGHLHQQWPDVCVFKPNPFWVQTIARQVGHLHVKWDSVFSANVAKIWNAPTYAQTLIPHQFSAKSVQYFLRNDGFQKLTRLPNFLSFSAFSQELLDWFGWKLVWDQGLGMGWCTPNLSHIERERAVKMAVSHLTCKCPTWRAIVCNRWHL